MRRPRYKDFLCPSCGNSEERFVETNDDDTPISPEICGYTDAHTQFQADDARCTDIVTPCQTEMQPMEIGNSTAFVAPINKKNSDFAERERARLQDRANDHWKKVGRANAIESEAATLERYRKQAGY